MALKNKTTTTYLALLLGIFGAHRFYLKGFGDIGGWLQAAVTAIGLVGMRRVWVLGQDDRLAWMLVPLFGFSLFAACLAAVVCGLMQEDKWNAAYNAKPLESHTAGGISGVSTGVTIFGVILALLLGTTALMSAIAYSGQKYFEAILKNPPVSFADIPPTA
jgi:TM2 domain-containing membrane protein YozV